MIINVDRSFLEINSLKNLNLPKEFTSNDIFSKRAEQLNLNEFLTLSTEIIKINHEV